jgi:hypothetical protein
LVTDVDIVCIVVGFVDNCAVGMVRYGIAVR